MSDKKEIDKMYKFINSREKFSFIYNCTSEYPQK